MFQKKYTSYTYIFRGTGKDFPRIYPWPAGKTPPRGYRERFPRGYTRGRPEKYHRAGTEEDSARIYPRPAGKTPPRGYREGFPTYIPETCRKNTAARVQEKISARIYPWPAGKTLPRGYRERFPANIPETGRKNTAARVQGKISREYTQTRLEKHRHAGIGKDFPRIYPWLAGKMPRRAGTGKDFARIYPWPAGKTPPRGYRERFPANVPVAGRESAAARVQGRFPREYTRTRPEKCRRAGTGEDSARIYPCPAGKTPPRGYRRRFPADIPVASRKNTTARVQGKISRECTRGRPGKRRRAGTGKVSARIYPDPAGKMPPRGYRRRFRANIPVSGRENTTTRVQEKISRGYTRGQPEKHHRAGTGEDFPRMYPRPAGKTLPRGYRERFPADIPVNMRRLAPRELY